MSHVTIKRGLINIGLFKELLFLGHLGCFWVLHTPHLIVQRSWFNLYLSVISHLAHGQVNNETNQSLSHFKVRISYLKIRSNPLSQRYLETIEINTERLSKIFADVFLNLSLLPRWSIELSRQLVDVIINKENRAVGKNKFLTKVPQRHLWGALND